MTASAIQVGANIADYAGADDNPAFRALIAGIGQHSTVLYFLRAFT